MQSADVLARRQGITRDEVLIAALEHYLAASEPNEREITAQLNAIYASEPSQLDPDLARLQSASLPKDCW